MDERDVLSSALPEPPPAAPARRERAIAKAMARFEDRPEAPEVSTARQRWLARRPQLGLAMAAALVVVVGLPMAWMYGDGRVADAPQIVTAAPSSVPQRSEAVAPAPQRALTVPVATPKPAVPETKHSAVSISPAPVRETAEIAPAPAPPSAEAYNKENARASQAPQGIAAPPPVVMARVAPPPPPPPPAASASATDNIVVTGALRRASNGSVACTLDDPRQDVSLCKAWINPGAHGDKGRAAAHVADGLTRAWQGDMHGAIEAFDAAIAVAPKMGIAYLERSQAYARLGDTDRALDDADKAVRYAPDARTYANRAALWRQRGEAGKARADERRAAALESAQ